MKTKEELQELKTEYETLNKKLAELTEEELAQVTGGAGSCDVFMDEDKAREMTEYEKMLIHEQPSQGMLA